MFHRSRRFPSAPLRRTPRIPVDYGTLVVSADGRARPARSLNPSLGGAFLECDDPPASGERLEVHIARETAFAEAVVPAVVRWSVGRGIGLEFDALGDDQRHAIEELIAHVPVSAGPAPA